VSARPRAQGVKVVRIEEFRHLSELLVIVDTHRCGVCRKSDRSVQVLSLSQPILGHVVHAGIELSPDTPLRYVGPRIAVGAHDYLSPHPGGMPVFSCKKHCSTPGWRVSKMKFHDTILPPLK